MKIHAERITSTMIKDERRLFNKNIPLTLFVTFACERELEIRTELQYIDPHSALCLSRSPGLLNRGPRGPVLCWMMAFFTASYHRLVSKTPSGVPRAPSAGCGFPNHYFSPTTLVPNCLTSCLDRVI